MATTNIKYPKDITIQHDKKTLVITPTFSPVTAESGETPITVYDKFSRLVVSILDQTAGNKTQVTTCNIPMREIDDIIDRSRFAKNHHLSLELAPVVSVPQTQENALAKEIFTEKLRFGKYKDKTPAEILLQDGAAAKEELMGAYRILKENVAKYPSNQKLMDAIREGVEAFKAGKLTGDATPQQPSSVFSVYNATARGLFRKQREDGMSPVRECSIKWLFGQKYPVEIEIVNYYAPIIQKENGMIQPQKSQRVEEVKGNMRITAAEWAYATKEITRVMNNFERVYGPGCYRLAEQALMDNIQRAKQQA